MAAQQLGDGSAQGGGLVLRGLRPVLGDVCPSGLRAVPGAQKGSADGLGCRDQSFQVIEKLLGSSQLLAQAPDAGALTAHLPSARQELLVLRNRESDRFHSSHGDA
ncbi:hypothetical protein ACIGO6_06115 [Streptomyces sp. NPDC053750]|uniref:hypothetical protein n=1 Tax=Streptomyces sp. NPDC053750 TaxID=3365714 RepID=UPI0037CDCC95